MNKEFNLSNEIQGWSTFPDFIPVNKFKEFIKLLKEEWKAKCKRMEVMSGDVANLELNWLLDKRAGDKLIK